MTIENALPDEVNKDLRKKGLLSENEVAIRIGDIVVAENVLTRGRRVLESDSSSLSESRQLLKG